MNNDLVEYIRTNQRIYTREALDNRLRGEGYTDEEIAAAWQQVLSEGPPVTEGPPAGTGGGSVAALVAVVVLLFVVGVVLLGLTNLGLGLSSSYGDPSPSPATVLQWFVNLGTLAVVVGLWIGGAWLMRRKGWSYGRIAGLVAAVGLVWYLVVTGTCLYGTGIL
jgi:hypothetical protein